ncbi:MAG: hypothetical protein ACYDHZ_10775, partial [Dehalococcoidia bacterium]
EMGFESWRLLGAEVFPSGDDIARTSDMLAALEAIVKSLSDQDDEGLIEHAPAMINARAAISKAKGEKP